MWLINIGTISFVVVLPGAGSRALSFIHRKCHKTISPGLIAIGMGGKKRFVWERFFCGSFFFLLLIVDVT